MIGHAGERDLLRDLAERVVEIATLPIQAERARLWKALNALTPERPMILANPQGGWRELVPESALCCEDGIHRRVEAALRAKLCRREQIHDDHPLTDVLAIPWVIEIGDYGLVETRHRTQELGSYRWDPPIKEATDLHTLHPRSIRVDHVATRRILGRVQEIVGDVLRVRLQGEVVCRCKLTRDLVHLRGLDQLMYDMYDDPDLVHQMMAFMRDEKLREFEVYEREGVLSLNNGPEHITGSGGIGHTDELPAEGFDGRVRMQDMWCWGESQETVGVGPAQFDEFVLQYQLPILSRFALVDYGCCEPLDQKLDLLIAQIPRLRWVSVSPWADRELAATKLADRYVYVYKPNPSRICSSTPDYDGAQAELCETLEIARGCCVSLIMKDTHTFHHEPHRLTLWTDMAQRVVAAMA